MGTQLCYDLIDFKSRRHDVIDTPSLSLKIECTVSESQTIHWWTWEQ